jgi:hypothetical protein
MYIYYYIGRLSIRLESMSFPRKELLYFGKNPSVRLRVRIRGNKAGLKDAGPSVGPKNYSDTIKPQEGKVIMNQSLGPIAPIRTQDADVVFDLLDMRQDKGEAVIGTTSVQLKEMYEQNNKDLVLNFKIRQNSGIQITSLLR